MYRRGVAIASGLFALCCNQANSRRDHHYREDWEWRDELLSIAQARLATWRSTLTNGRPSSVLDDVRAALDDDLDSPGALGAIDDAAHAGFNVAPAATLLGINL